MLFWVEAGVDLPRGLQSERSEVAARPNRLFSLHACRAEIDRDIVWCPFLDGREGIEQESKEGEEAT